MQQLRARLLLPRLEACFTVRVTIRVTVHCKGYYKAITKGYCEGCYKSYYTGSYKAYYKVITGYYKVYCKGCYKCCCRGYGFSPGSMCERCREGDALPVILVLILLLALLAFVSNSNWDPSQVSALHQKFRVLGFRV